MSLPVAPGAGRSGSRWPAGDRRGFVMIMVVLLLFAVAVAGATGYQMVAAEVELSTGAEDAQVAAAAARAGLDRYIGEHLGVPGDTMIQWPIAVGDTTVARVTVVPHRLVAHEDPEIPDLYLIKSVGEVTDPRYPDSPSRRTLTQYARLNKSPVNAKGAVMSVANIVSIDPNASIRGTDQAAEGVQGSALNVATGACQGTDARNAFGTVARTTGGSGAPEGGGRLGLATAAAVIDTASVAWSVLQDANNFPLKHQSPNYPAYAAHPDSFFVVRVVGNLNATTSHSGRGVLIVTGNLGMGSFSTFTWEGIVLAGSVSNAFAGLISHANIQGALITGLDLPNQTTFTVGSTLGSAQIWNNSCNIARANRVLAHFELIEGTRWEF